MAARLLTTGSTIQCAHGAPALLRTANPRVSAGERVLLETDVHTVNGCSFMVGNKKSPCVRVEWSRGATRAKIGGTAPLFSTSVGQCLSAEGATQGVALVASFQQRASAR